MGALFDILVEQHQANRILDLENASSPVNVKGDFEGSVTGTWVRLDPDGTGIVSYRQKQYKSVVLGLVSLPAGTKVELSHADGVYYSSF